MPKLFASYLPPKAWLALTILFGIGAVAMGALLVAVLTLQRF